MPRKPAPASRPTDEVRIEPLRPANFPALAALFNQGGDPRWCFCTFWRLRSKDWAASSPSRNRSMLRNLASRDPAPGLVALRDGHAIGWVGLGPREDFERLEHSRVRPRLDDLPVWSVVCFVVSKSARGEGLARRLLDAAVAYARDHGAPGIEAYPVAPDGEQIDAAKAYTGVLSMFGDASFREVREVESPTATVRRTIVRLDLGGIRPGVTTATKVSGGRH
ncbi:MAG TPA: GNAT family N-acetyltransferase [Candidatus Limnocylindrales bacterium]